MSGNSFGQVFRLTTFGESHGYAVGGIIDGCPPRLNIDIDFIQEELDRRKPQQSIIASQRGEKDKVEIISGVFEGKSLGTPIAFIIKNQDQKSEDYNYLKDVYRPSHGDFTYEKKYGIRDYRGGGRASARETVARVVAGAIAKLILKKIGIKITAYVSQIGDIELKKNYEGLDFNKIEKSLVRCPDEEISDKMLKYLEKLKIEGDTAGGVVSCVIKGLMVGLGEPVFDKLQAELAKAMLSINAAKGFEYGSGFKGAAMKGSVHNDLFRRDFTTETNYSGGIQAGISNGEDIYFRVAFKPVSTIMKPQKSVDKNGNEVLIKPTGRHDVCLVPRVVPIVEAMTAIVLADHYLRQKTIS